jgi:hypothetical protein
MYAKAWHFPHICHAADINLNCCGMQGRPVSSFEPAQIMSAGLPPRLVNPASLVNLKQVDFVGYAVNPEAKRHLPRGEASRRVAALRNHRRRGKFDAQTCGSLERSLQCSYRAT